MSNGLKDALLFKWDDDEITQKIFVDDSLLVWGDYEPKCECGAWKTYGKDKCSSQMHAEWCKMKRDLG